jgi:hypothetical protein
VSSILNSLLHKNSLIARVENAANHGLLSPVACLTIPAQPARMLVLTIRQAATLTSLCICDETFPPSSLRVQPGTDSEGFCFVGRVKIEGELLEMTPQGFLVKQRSPSGQPITAQELAAQQIAGLLPQVFFSFSDTLTPVRIVFAFVRTGQCFRCKTAIKPS